MQNLTHWSLPWWRYHGRLRRLCTGGVEMTDSVDMCHFTLLRGLLESVSLILVGACALHMGNICYMFSHWVHDKNKTKNLHKVLLLYTLLHNSYISFYIHKRKLCTEPINTTPHIFTVDVNFSFSMWKLEMACELQHKQPSPLYHGHETVNMWTTGSVTVTRNWH